MLVDRHTYGWRYLLSFLLPGEEDVSGDVNSVVGGLVVVVGVVLGSDAVGRDVPLEDHRSDCEHIFDEY